MATETISFNSTDVTNLANQLLNIYEDFGVNLPSIEHNKFKVAENDLISIAVAILTCNMNLVEAAVEQMLPVRSTFVDRHTHQKMCHEIIRLADKYRKEKDAYGFY